MVSVSVSNVVGRGFAPWPGDTQDHNMKGTQALVTVQADCFKGRVAYEDKHYGDLLGPIVRLAFSPARRRSHDRPFS